MGFFTYRMPPFLVVMGFLYILVAAPFILSMLRQGYWRGVWGATSAIIRCNYGLVIAAVLATLACIEYLDLPCTLWVKYLDTITQSYTFWDFICSCAEGGFVAGVLFSGFMLASYFQRNVLAEVCKISFMSSVYGGLANAVLKFIFNRQRPAIGLEPWNFFEFFKSGASHFIDLTYAYNSMPSGHTISTLAALVPFWLVYKHKGLRCGMLIWALMVNFSRIYTINHWLSDVFMASLCGGVIGLAVYRVNQFRITRIISAQLADEAR